MISERFIILIILGLVIGLLFIKVLDDSFRDFHQEITGEQLQSIFSLWWSKITEEV